MPEPLSGTWHDCGLRAPLTTPTTYYVHQARQQGVGCFSVRFPQVLRVLRALLHVPLSQALVWERKGWRLVGT